MTKAVLHTFSLLMIIFMNHSLFGDSQFIQSLNTCRVCLTAMEALDLVKEQYADNFEKVYTDAATVKEPEADKAGAEINQSETCGAGKTTDKTNRPVTAKSVTAQSDISEEVYFYKLPFKDYYLVYEGKGDTKDTFIIRLYEYVLDEPDLNLGHTVTYGWYSVDKWTGKITEITD